MQQFKNEYEYTDELIKESITAWWEWRIKKQKIMFYICIVFFGIWFVVQKQVMYLIPAILGVGGLILIKFRIRNEVKMEKQRARVMYPNKIPHISVEIGEDLKLSSGDNTRHLKISDIENYKETKNLIVLFLKGKMTIALSKQGFVEGTPQEMIAFLKK